MKDFAGSMRERVELLKRTAGRDALGEGEEDWTLVGLVWGSAVPIGHGPDYRGGSLDRPTLWRMTLRPCPVAVGDRIARVTNTLEVREVTADPALPDRVVIVGEAIR